MAQLFTAGASYPPSHAEYLQYLTRLYEDGLRSGSIKPFVQPFCFGGIILAVAYLLIDHRKNKLIRHARFPIFALCAFMLGRTILHHRSIGLALGYGPGLVCSWVLTWVAVLLLIDDPQRDYQRIEVRKPGDTTVAEEVQIGVRRLSNGGIFSGSETEVASSAVFSGSEADPKKLSASGAVSSDDTASQSSSELTYRGKKSTRAQNGYHQVSAQTNGHAKAVEEGEPRLRFKYQPYPDESLLHRLWWVLDVVLNFQGAGWNWQISSLPPPPSYVLHDLHNLKTSAPALPSRQRASRTGNVVYPTRRSLFKQSLKTFVICYVAVDVLFNFVVHTDPYFYLGDASLPPPPYLPAIFKNALLLRVYRLLVTTFIIHSILSLIFILSPLCICFLLPAVFPALRKTHLAQPWVYPTSFGAFSQISTRGLSGYWSCWWHQSFRSTITAPSRLLVEKLDLPRRSNWTKALQLVIAFTMTGFYHLSASLTMGGQRTSPFKGPFLFFLVQAPGILIQRTLTHTFHAHKLHRRFPKRVSRFVTFAYAFLWFVWTGPMLTDDFAKGGIWLFSPLPLSLVRWLMGDGLWTTWGGRWAYIPRWAGLRWWEKGFALW